MNPDFRATGMNVFVEMDGDDIVGHEAGHELKEQGGVSMPANDWRKIPKGTVVAAGPGAQNMPVLTKVGDRVLLSPAGANTITIEGKEYRVVDDREILAVIEGE